MIEIENEYPKELFHFQWERVGHGWVNIWVDVSHVLAEPGGRGTGMGTDGSEGLDGEGRGSEGEALRLEFSGALVCRQMLKYSGVRLRIGRSMLGGEPVFGTPVQRKKSNWS
ncbi:hypothetical protein E2C01_101208 [Portunus trituberculatus]|uniref:Uncharacterized protein n=1 Tax=Portunus trituberculatus TaxID=210409 RepID=A0A5B7KA21_PORTR|nr:hypothetical protein [Portunus trituberculatus]